MNRINRYLSIFGENWLIGRYLIKELAAIAIQCDGYILDLACGQSPFEYLFNNNSNYIRVDKYTRADDVINADMYNLPFKNDVFSTVLLFQAISDVPEPKLVLREIKRVLQNGGILIVFENMSYPEHDMPDDFYRIMPAGLCYLACCEKIETEYLKNLGGLFTRFAVLWNTFIMGALKKITLLAPFALAGILLGNIIFYALDKMFMRPTLSSDYIAVLRKK